MKKSTKFFIFISILTIFFCLAIGFDISPYLRGPSPYPPEWQWAYFFVNTLSNIYLPIIFILFLVGFFWLHEIKKIFEKKTNLLLFFLITLSFLFQMSLLFFSRSGVSVLVGRIINPELNSYFTASLSIQNPIDFLKNYQQEMTNFVYHARSHPPGAILIFYGIKQLITPFTYFIDLISHINPAHSDIKQIWSTLLPIDKTTAILSAFLIPFVSTLAIIPLFYAGKILYGAKVAARSAFLFILVPSIVFFIPINDVLLPFFSISSFLFLLMGLQNNSLKYFCLSGIILFLGVSISLALLPLLLLFLLLTLLYIRNKKLKLNPYIRGGIFFIFGFLLFPILLFIFFNLNFITLIQTIFNEVPHVHSRSYSLWLFYNIYDFLVFTGIPIAIIFLTQIKKFNKSDSLFVAFLITLIVVDLSGSTRGETGRIWSPYLPFIVLPVAAFLTNKIKFSANLFIGLLLMQAIQILVMQEFWVMLW